MRALAAALADAPKRRHCVLLWMNGGPSQIDTFDLKPRHANGGEFRETQTTVPGLQFSEHLPRLASMAEHLAVIRSLSTGEGDHGRATHLMRTGHQLGSAARHPTLGAWISKELGRKGAGLVNSVSTAPNRIVGPGCSPLYVDAAARGHGAARRMGGVVAEAFDLGKEPTRTRDAFGLGVFGQGCLAARRLIERGVPFVEVSWEDSAHWDTHRDNFSEVKRLSAELDGGWSALMADLRDRGLLQCTTIIWSGEFGRTPKINNRAGRDHYPAAWTSVLAGGGVQGGQAYGRTSRDGTVVEERPVGVGDLLATLCVALGLDPRQQNASGAQRHIRLADGEPIKELLA
jgi:hypothetical protein